MSVVTKLSLASNVALAGLVVLLAWQRASHQFELVRSSRAVSNIEDKPAISQFTPDQQQPQSQAEPFHWSQIESPDYRTYIANLRGIGCPEATIRDIITADVHSLYQGRRDKLERRMQAGLRDSEKELRGLQQEEESVIFALLGPSSGRSSEPAVVATETPGSQRGDGEAQGVATRLPLVFENLNDGENSNLSDVQRDVFSRLQDLFREQIGQEQSTNELAYAQRWQRAQSESDRMLRGALGNKFFLDYQVAQNRAALARR